MANHAALVQLGNFMQHPSKKTASKLVLIPALLSVLVSHKGAYPAELMEVCRWIHQRGCEVLKQLIKHTTDPPADLPQEDWSKVK